MRVYMGCPTYFIFLAQTKSENPAIQPVEAKISSLRTVNSATGRKFTLCCAKLAIATADLVWDFLYTWATRRKLEMKLKQFTPSFHEMS